MSQIAARFTRVRTTATTTPFEATGDEKKSAGLFVMTEYDGSLTYGVPFIAVRKYSRKATLVPSSVGTDAATMVPFGSTTATDSYSGERAAAAASAVRARTRKVLVPPWPPSRTIRSNNTRKTCPRTWRTSGQRNDQEARRRQGLRLHPDRGRLGHLFPPVAGGRRRVRYPP